MVVGSMPKAQFHIQADGVWVEVEAPSGRRAAVNLAAVAEASDVGEVFQEWCDWHVARMVAQEA